jgi:hypothetical protein
LAKNNLWSNYFNWSIVSKSEVINLISFLLLQIFLYISDLSLIKNFTSWFKHHSRNYLNYELFQIKYLLLFLEPKTLSKIIFAEFWKIYQLISIWWADQFIIYKLRYNHLLGIYIVERKKNSKRKNQIDRVLLLFEFFCFSHKLKDSTSTFQHKYISLFFVGKDQFNNIIH